MMPLAAREKVTGTSYAWSKRANWRARSGGGLDAGRCCGIVESSQWVQEPEVRLVEGQQARFQVSPPCRHGSTCLRVRTEKQREL